MTGIPHFERIAFVRSGRDGRHWTGRRRRGTHRRGLRERLGQRRATTRLSPARPAPRQILCQAMTRPTGFEQLSGDDWQDLCLRVLHEQHPGAELVEVPDDDRGDAGLEAFSLSGCAYQCYAPEGEPLTMAQRYAKQRAKMTADLAKFIDNTTKISALLPAGLTISRWVLLVPRINSRKLVEHAKALTERVREAALPYAATDIVVVALTLDAFERATVAVVSRQLSKLELPPLETIDYSDIDDELIAVMNTKLAMTAQYADEEKRSKIVNRLLESYVSGLSHRSHVSDYYSELGDRLELELADLEDRLAVQYALSETVPDRRLNSVLIDTEAVVDEVLNTRAPHSRVIAEGQVADWLMRCPLDFT
jgi:hypothetical protein